MSASASPNIATDRGRGNFTAPVIVATGLAVVFVGAIMPTPLYPLYRQAFGFSGVTLTFIYAVYVLGNLIALLLLGRLADQIGRRTVKLPAIGFGILSTLAFALADSTAWLLAARILSGLATGLAAGAATAWIADLYDHRGDGAAARLAAAGNFFGCSAGPLLAGFLAEFAPAPLQLCFFVYLALLCAAAFAILFVPETVKNPKRLGAISLKPRLGVPYGIRLQFVSPAVGGFAVFSLIGFYAALIPSLLAESLHVPSPVVSGAIVGEVFGIAALTILLTGWLASQATLLTALALLLPSVWLLIGAEIARSLSLLFVSAALCGITGGLGYRGTLEVINRIAPADQRSEVVSSYLVALFAGNSVPVIGIGLLSAETGTLSAHVTFAVVITALAGIAAATGIRYAPNAH
jgi:predicted MFS family arabinose efflux permease